VLNEILEYQLLTLVVLSSIMATALNDLFGVQYVFLTGRFSTRLVGANYLLAKCDCMSIVTSWNFRSKKKFVFAG